MAKTIKKLPGKKAAMPKDVIPMLATLVDAPFDDAGWVYEIKWDGYRALAYINKGKVELRSRNNKSFNEKFYAVYDALKKLKINAVIDGEIIVANKAGLADFSRLQNWRSEADGPLLFYVFDILWLDGRSLMEVSFSERRKILEKILPKSDTILLSEVFDTKGTQFFKMAEKMKLEGIMAKRTDSVYIPGNRSRDWLKIKTALRQEVVIGG